MQSLLHFNQALLGASQLLTNYSTCNAVDCAVVKRFGQYFVILVRLSTGYGIRTPPQMMFR